MVEFLTFFNEKSHKSYQVTDSRREKLEARLKKYSMDEIKRATIALLKSPFHTGTNENNTWYATPDFLLRNDEMVDNWLNKYVPPKQSANDYAFDQKTGRYVLKSSPQTHDNT